MPRVLIAEDSIVVAEILKHMFEAEADFDVLGVATDGEQAVRMAAELRPDVITMDVMMPKLDGVQATERIMEETPTPIVVISSHVNDGEMQVSFRSLAAGALSVLEKPEDIFSPTFEARHRSFLNTIRAMADVKVHRRRSRKPVEHHADPVALKEDTYDLVALGSSTGGPQALVRVLSRLPADYPLPIVIAQHISRGFTSGLVQWLNSEISLTAVIGTHDDVLQPGTVYFAPDGCDIEVRPDHDRYRLFVSEEKPEGALCPNVNVLFGSVARGGARHVVAGLLTGMGTDGAVGLGEIRQAGGWTFAEAEESCVVYGMPQAAVQHNAAREVLHIDAVPERLMAVTGDSLSSTLAKGA